MKKIILSSILVIAACQFSYAQWTTTTNATNTNTGYVGITSSLFVSGSTTFGAASLPLGVLVVGTNYSNGTIIYPATSNGVNRAIRLDQANNAVYIVNGGADGGGGFMRLDNFTGETRVFSYNANIGNGSETGGFFTFYNNNAERARLTAGGNFGLANNSPGELLTLGKAGTTKGVLSFAGNTSGKVILQPAAAAGSWTMTLPTSAGTNGYLLQTDGAGITSWVAPPTAGTTSASALTGTTLPATLVSSSLTTVGTITGGIWHGGIIPVAYGGTGTGTTLAGGSVVFANTDGSYYQDNANLFWSMTNQCLNIGTTSSPAGYKLAVKGKVIAESVKVQLYSGPWSDYVFAKDYKLRSLTEVKSYIDQHQHLPEMPSASEVDQNGLDLGTINNLLTKKVEELTLYAISQENSIKEQNAKIDAQAKDLAELKKQMALLLNKK